MAKKNPEDLAYVRRIKHSEEFPKLMAAFEKQSDKLSVGQKRPSFNFGAFISSQKVGAGGSAEVWARPMAWKAFRSWGLKDDGGEMKDDEEVAKEWERLRSDPSTVRDFKGRGGSLRLHVNAHEYTRAYAYAEANNQLQQQEQHQGGHGGGCAGRGGETVSHNVSSSTNDFHVPHVSVEFTSETQGGKRQHGTTNLHQTMFLRHKKTKNHDLLSPQSCAIRSVKLFSFFVCCRGV